ncbi:MAG: hypothetical protein JNM47_02795 [Hyphomonadaceae bacterium]|nr:hypothetical protein [Hyphomonadaceae bacterium]
MEPDRDPDGEIVKEVYARFGLAVYFAQCCETSLIGLLADIETASCAQPSQAKFDEFYLKNEKLTFGNLLRKFEKLFSPDGHLLARLHAFKLERDELSHRFFRKHSLRLTTVGGCTELISMLETVAASYESIDADLAKLAASRATQRGMPESEYLLKLAEIERELFDKASHGQFD